MGSMSDTETLSEPEEKRPVTSFDDVLHTVGDTGRFQLILYVLFLLMDAAAAAVLMVFVFDSIDPGFICPGPDVNSSSSAVSDVTDDVNPPPECQPNGEPCVNFTFLGDRSTVVTQFGLICSERYRVKLAQSISFVGVLCGATCSQLSDIFGRKRSLLVIWPLLMVLSSCQMFTYSYTTFIIVRFLSNACVGMQLSVTTCLTVEYFGPKWRSVASCRIGFQFGELVADLSAYLLYSWRHCALVVGLFTAPIYPIFFFLIPESPRWLIQKGRLDAAYNSLCRIARWNRKPQPDFEMLKRVHSTCIDDKKNKNRYNFLHLYSTQKLMKTSLIIQFSWACLGMLSYGISSQMSTLVGSVYLNFAIAKILTMVTRWTVIFLLNRCGRKKTHVGSWAVMITLLVVIISLDLSGVSAVNRLPVSYIAAITESISNFPWSSVLMLTSELYPTLIRNVGIGAGHLAARFGSIFGPQIAALDAYHMTIPFIIYAGLGLISVILVLVYIPETNNKPLPDDLPPPQINCCCRRSQQLTTDASDGDETTEMISSKV